MLFVTRGLGEVSEARKEIAALGDAGPDKYAVQMLLEGMDRDAIAAGSGPVEEPWRSRHAVPDFNRALIRDWCRTRPPTCEVALGLRQAVG